MACELRAVGPAERRRAYAEHFRAAFPPAELRPLESMEALIAAGEYRFLGMYEGAEALGYAAVWLDGRYVLLDYLCVPAAGRGQGRGAALLDLLRRSFPPEAVIFWESEAPVGDPDRDALIARRLAFYRRCGAVTAGFDAALFGVHYKVLAYCAGKLDEAALLTAYRGYYRRLLPERLYRRAVRIPYTGGPLPAFGNWIEGEQ